MLISRPRKFSPKKAELTRLTISLTIIGVKYREASELSIFMFQNTSSSHFY